MSISLTGSLEDYLEAIYNIILDKNGVRVKDISKYLKVKNSSVTTALKTLAKEGFINYEPYGIISLTSKGNEMSKKIIYKHKVIELFFRNILFVDKKLAGEVACKIEHIIPDEVFKKFKLFMKYLSQYKEENPSWFEELKKFYEKNINNNESSEDF